MTIAISPKLLGEEVKTDPLPGLNGNPVSPSNFPAIQEKIGLIFPGWKIVEDDPNNKINKNNILLVVEPPDIKVCPFCGKHETVYKHGVRETMFLDVPRNAYRVGLLVKRQRLRCLQCEKTFLPLLPELDVNRKMTNRLVEWIEERAKRDTYANVARECGLSPKMVREIWLQKHSIATNKIPSRPVPEFLGIDEVYIGTKFRCVLTDLKERKVFDILDNRMRDSLKKYFKDLPDYKTIQVVCIDLHKQYLEAITEVELDAKIVVDRFHVVSLAIRALDKVRIRLQNDLKTDKERKELRRLGKILLRQRRGRLNDHGRAALDKWLSRYPELKIAYWLKEGVIDLYSHSDRDDAESHYNKWAAVVPAHIEEFEKLRKTLEGWKKEILAYFEISGFPNGITNGFTEQVNRQIKAINSKGRGYRFDYLREKILQGEIGAKIEHGGLYRIAFQPNGNGKDKQEEDGRKKTKVERRGAKAYARREEVEQFVEPLVVIAESDKLKTDFKFSNQIDWLLEQKQTLAGLRNGAPAPVGSGKRKTKKTTTTSNSKKNDKKAMGTQPIFNFGGETPPTE